MVDVRLKPALRLALRLNEIGGASPYQLSFAGKGKSGASFGFMQGDMAAHQPVVQHTFRAALTAEAFPAADIDAYDAALSVPLIACPLPNVTRFGINAALLDGRAMVDAMDESILGAVYDSLNTCLDAAADAGCAIQPKALLYMAMWINMTGPPTSLLTWLSGGIPALRRAVPPAGAEVDGPSMETYLAATDYYTENPGNLPHIMQSAAGGAALLP